MERWIDGARMKLRAIMAVVAVLFVAFGFMFLRPPPVQTGISTLHPSESSGKSVHPQAQALGLFAQEVEALTAMPIEADLLDDGSGNERGITECMPHKAPVRDPLGLCSVRAELLIAVQSFGSRNTVLLI
jgi:hypothetical protein